MTSAAAAACPDCGAPAPAGPRIPDGRVFGGEVLDAPLAGGRLHRCPACFLRFRWPRVDPDRLRELYAETTGRHWACRTLDHARFEWSRAYRDSRAHLPRSGRVYLDVGCFDGGFLSGLDNADQRWGVEPNPRAASIARGAGVRVVPTVEELPAAQTFDVIALFDVLEHVPAPRRLLEDLVGRLRPSGLLIFSTGNLDHWTAWVGGGSYWYVANPEHVSFLSRRWLDGVLAEWEGLHRVSYVEFSHARRHSRAFAAAQGLWNGLYRVAPSLVRALRLRGAGERNLREAGLAHLPPTWVTARDHFYCCLQRRPG